MNPRIQLRAFPLYPTSIDVPGSVVPSAGAGVSLSLANWVGSGAFDFNWLKPPRNGIDDDAPFLNAMLAKQAACVITPGLLNIKTPVVAPLPNTKIECLGGMQAVEWRRDLGCTGNTLTFASPSSVAAGCALIDAWFTHAGRAAGSSAALTNRLTQGESHIAVHYAQKPTLRVGGYGCPFFITFFGGSGLLLETPFFYGGIWDPYNSARQEAIAHVRLLNHATYGHPTNFVLRNAEMYGSIDQTTRSLTIGTKTYSTTQRNGPQFGLLVQSCEDWTVEGGFSGQYATANIMIEPLTTADILMNGTVNAHRIDESNTSGIMSINTVGTAQALNVLQVFDCLFNGQLIGKHGMWLRGDGGYPSVARLSMHDNRFTAHTSSSALLTGVAGGEVHHNRFSGYNLAGNNGGSGGSFDDISGLVLEAPTANVQVSHNRYGGGYNLDDQTNNCQYGFVDLTTGAGNTYYREKAINLGLAGGSVTSGGTLES